MTELLPQLGPRHPALGWIVGIEQGDHFAGMGDEGREALLDSVLRYVPTNLLLNAIRTRRGRKRGIPAMLLGVPYLYATVICTTIVNGGGAGWLNLLALLFFWNAHKFVWIGPLSRALLSRARFSEHRNLSCAASQRPAAAEEAVVGSE